MWFFTLVVTFGIALCADDACSNEGKFNKSAISCPNEAGDEYCEDMFGTSVADGGEIATRPEKCAKTPAYKKSAIADCAKTCGFCCENPAYNCVNKPVNMNCDKIDPATYCSAGSPWRTLVAKECPSACGYCGMDGCVDVADGCEDQKNLCKSTDPTWKTFVYDNCKRTCNLCDLPPPVVNPPTGATTTPKPNGQQCVDLHSSCASWAKNDYCTNPWYLNQPEASPAKYCRKTCKFCQ